MPEINERVDFERQSIMGHSMGGHGALTIVEEPCEVRERERVCANRQSIGGGLSVGAEGLQRVLER